MPWYTCTVNEVGPAIDGAETPAPVVYINLTDTKGSFANTWFYAANGGQSQMLDVGIAAINNNNHVQVAARAPNAGGSTPYTEITRIYELRPQPPAAPTNFHLVGISSAGANVGQSLITVGWSDNSDDEEGFNVVFKQIPNGAPGLFGFPANSMKASFPLDGGYDYTIYVEAWNHAGQAKSNSIIVTVIAAASLSASVILVSVPGFDSNYQLSIKGSNFGKGEQVLGTVDWSVGGDPSVAFPIQATADAVFGAFSTMFSGTDPVGFCPILVPFGQPQPPQMFRVTAKGVTSQRTASATAGPFTCP
jgi:hypothetical protein